MFKFSTRASRESNAIPRLLPCGVVPAALPAARNSQTKPLSSDRLIAAHAQFFAVRQYHQVIAMEPGMDLLDPLHVDQSRAVNSLEVAGIELMFQIAERCANFVTARSRMHADIIPRRLNPVDFPCRHKLNAPMLGDR